MSDDLSGFSMHDLFRQEVESHARSLSDSLLALEQDPREAERLQVMMRAAHSIKGAARLVGVDVAVRVAHVMEDCFVAAQEGRVVLDDADAVDTLLSGVDMLREIAALADGEAAAWAEQRGAEVDVLVQAVEAVTAGKPAAKPAAKKKAAGKAPAKKRVRTKKSAPADQAPPPAETPAPVSGGDLSGFSMFDLFRQEVESHTRVLSARLLALEQNPRDAEALEAMMRAAHSVKGAARLVGVDVAVRVAHVLEECFVAAQEERVVLDDGATVDLLLGGVDLLSAVAAVDEAGVAEWGKQHRGEVGQVIDGVQAIIAGTFAPAAASVEPVAAAEPAPSEPPAAPAAAAAAPKAGRATAAEEASLRVAAGVLNRLMGYAGEAQVEAGNLRPFANDLLQLRHRQVELLTLLDDLGETLRQQNADEFTLSMFRAAQHKAVDCRQLLTERMSELEIFERRTVRLADRLSREVIASRMRPFIDGVHGFPRMVRDVARSLGKKVRFQINGQETKVDRDILDRIEAPLNHMLRNAIDHGLESPEERAAAGKPAEGRLTLEALHHAGMLSIVVEDDGRGVDLESLRRRVVAKGMVSERMAADLGESELLDFLFLPSFSTRDQVSEISGRGVGLDVVHSVVQEMRGVLHASSRPGDGMRIHLQLPLSLSTIRALLVRIAREPYAFPLARIERTLMVRRDSIETMEGRQYVTYNGEHIGLITADQLLDLDAEDDGAEELPVVVISDRNRRFGIVVEGFLGERRMVVRPLDPRLGKVQDVAAASVLEDGTPVLIADVDDMLRSIEVLISGGRLQRLSRGEEEAGAPRKRILVVDDSITVREVERNMLEARGYAVDVAVDGMDGWNAVRVGDYALVVSDVDMPRMNGIELVGMIKNDPRLKSLPVMIVSYKDREEDRSRGLEVGADYYLAKGSFHDETLIEAVADLIGPA